MSYAVGFGISVSSFCLGVVAGAVAYSRYYNLELLKNVNDSLVIFLTMCAFLLGFLLSKLKKEPKFKPTTFGEVRAVSPSEFRAVIDASIRRSGLEIRKGGS